MCKCCEDINSLLVVKDEKSNYKYHAIIRRERYIGTMWKGDVYGGAHELNYCPMCGRYLKEEEL